MAVSPSELVSLQRSAGMLRPGQQLQIERDTLYELCSELIEYRELVSRLGTDLRTVAQRSRDR